MFSGQDEMDMVECPYNKSHRMLRKRLQPHLIKCRINYPDVELQKCPFNNTHLIPEPEFVHHVTNCSDRKLISQYKYDAPESKEEDCPKHAPVECEENWDDTEVEDYNPIKYAEKACILRRPVGIVPSERKAFVKSERKRLGDYSSDEDEFADNKSRSLQRRPMAGIVSGIPSVKSEPKHLGNYSSDEDDVRRRNLRRRPSVDIVSTIPIIKSERKLYGDYSSDEDDNYESARRKPPTPPPPSWSGYHPPSPRNFNIRDRSRSPNSRNITISRRLASPDHRSFRSSPDYSLDDDPYYNGGATSSRNDEYSIGSRRPQCDVNSDSYPYSRRSYCEPLERRSDRYCGDYDEYYKKNRHNRFYP